MLRKQLNEFNNIMLGIERVYEDYAKDHNLTYMSLTVLEIVYYAENPLTQKEITNMCHYNKQVVNSIIKQFYDKGYILLKELKEDRRNKSVTLSKKGKVYADEILLPLWKIEKNALTNLTDEERELMLKLMNKCYTGFSKIDN